MIFTTSAGRALRTLQRRQLNYINTAKRAKTTQSSTHSTKPTVHAEAVQSSNVNPINIPASSWAWLEPVKTPYRLYTRSQSRRPLLTQFISSLTIYLLGDISAQTISTNPSEDGWDFARTARMLTISALSSIPSYKWFMWLGQSFNYASKSLSLATKVLVNQIVFTPLFNTYFFGMQSLLTGAEPEEIWERVRRTVPASVVNSCKLWPAVTAFSFTFIRPENRSIFGGVIAIGWQTYLSLLNERAKKEEAVAHAHEHDYGLSQQHGQQQAISLANAEPARA